MFRVYFSHRRAVLVEHVPVDASQAARIGEVMRNHQSIALHAEAAQFVDMVGVVQRLVVVGEDDALVAERARMPFEPEEGGEFSVAVGVGDQPLHLGPGLAQFLETAQPVVFPASLHRLEVVPARMAGEGEEVEMGTGNVDAALHRPDAVAVSVVIVDVAVKDPVRAAHRLPVSTN